VAGTYESSLELSRELHHDLYEHFPAQAAYTVALAFRVRYVMQMSAREAMHVIELRSGQQGHPAYRHIVQEMHRLIAEQAGHRVLADMMTFADHDEHALGRLAAEHRAEARRTAAP
jgi:thymidylate synthase ThyX